MHNATNERIKRRYLIQLKEADGQSEATVDAVAKALSRFEEATKWRDFGTFRKEQAMAFKARLAAENGKANGQKLSKSTLYATLSHLRRFFEWLSREPKFRARVSANDAAYFNLSDKETRVARAHREAKVPTLEQLRRAIAAMPSTSEIEQRDRAIFAFVLLTGIRDSALVSLKLKHVDVVVGSVQQDGRDVRTKNSKTFVTVYFPIGGNERQIVSDWIGHLRMAKNWGDDDPVFPATRVAPDSTRRFAVTGLARQHWSSAAPVRKVFRAAFAAAGLTYFNPHSVRNTLVQLGEQLCHNAEDFKVWSQNLGHEHVSTTFTSYGHVPIHRHVEVMHGFAARDVAPTPGQIAQLRALLDSLNRSDAVSAP
jgi:integrase